MALDNTVSGGTTKYSGARQVAALTHLAIGCWIASLFLPVFGFEPQESTVVGGFLLLGLPFAWLFDGWAVYANIFFWYVVFRLHSGMHAIVPAGIMVFLAVTTLWFSSYPNILNFLNYRRLPIVSWGWGYVVWCAAILILVSAAIERMQIFGKKFVPIALTCTLGFVLIFVHVHFVQRSVANEQDRDNYLWWGMAYTTTELCDVPLTRPDATILRGGVLVALEFDARLIPHKSDNPTLRVPEFSVYRQGGHDWYEYQDERLPGGMIRVAYPIASDRFVVTATKNSRGALIRLTDGVTQKVLYEQPFSTVRNKGGDSVYCPHPSQYVSGLETLGYDKVLSSIVGQQRESRDEVINLHAESAHQPCNVDLDDSDRRTVSLKLDSRHAKLDGSFRGYAGFCSESYVGLVKIGLNMDTNEKSVHSAAFIFDRKTLLPLRAFHGSYPCKSVCTGLPQKEIVGIRVSNLSAVAETLSEEVVLDRSVQCTRCTQPVLTKPVKAVAG